MKRLAPLLLDAKHPYHPPEPLPTTPVTDLHCHTAGLGAGNSGCVGAFVDSSVGGALVVTNGWPVSSPPRKNPKPSTQSQCGQMYMTSFFTLPATSRRITCASAGRLLSSNTTGFLQ